MRRANVSGVSRTSAVRTMRIAQIAGLGMVALAAGAVMFRPGLPERDADWADQAGPGVETPPDEGNRKLNLSRQDIDTAGAGSSLDDLGKIVKAEITPITPPPIDPESNNTTDVAPRGWAYLGGVFEPTVNFALVNINGKQRMLRQGQEVPELKARILSIDPERIEIEREGRRERIERSKPSATLVSVSETGAGIVAGSTVISPGENTARTARTLQREDLENNPDIDKRRAEFLRRQQERQGIDR